VLLQQLEQKDDIRQFAADYMEEHNINLLFQKLCTSLIYSKPENPEAFLIDELKKLQQQGRSDRTALSLLTDEDLDTMFNMVMHVFVDRKAGTLFVGTTIDTHAILVSSARR
jgi:hypothetical protein